jgi:hypothetical protein
MTRKELIDNTSVIESAKRDELYKVASFLDSCWRAEYTKIVDADFLREMSIDKRHESLLARFDNEQSRFWVLREGERIVGASVFGRIYAYCA